MKVILVFEIDSEKIEVKFEEGSGFPKEWIAGKIQDILRIFRSVKVMTYGLIYNRFFKTNVTLTDSEKLNMLELYPTSDVLTILRNIEEAPFEFTEKIIKGVYKILFDRNIYCI